jgi:hypothetical protein
VSSLLSTARSAATTCRPGDRVTGAVTRWMSSPSQLQV